MAEAPDLSSEFNTKLSPEEEKRFQAWAQKTGRVNDVYDYDLRGAWKSDAKAASNGHLPDTWKKPNHPTFSDESRYSSDKLPGGKWSEGEGGKWRFRPSLTNIHNLGTDGLRRYFREAEPDSVLELPLSERLYPSKPRRR